MKDAYSIIKKESVNETKVKGSRFIGRTFLADNIPSASKKLSDIRKLEYSASHNCYAYQIGATTNERAFKYSDDGEPSGTAGKPIYDIICGSGLTNLLLVVTRYFGGTKLGTGGLSRAYSDCAKAVLEKSGREECFLSVRFEIVLDFPFYDPFNKLLQRFDVVDLDVSFGEKVRITIDIRRSHADKFIEEINEMTSGRAEIVTKA